VPVGGKLRRPTFKESSRQGTWDYLMDAGEASPKSAVVIEEGDRRCQSVPRKSRFS